MSKRTLWLTLALIGMLLLAATWFLSTLDTSWVLNNPYPADQSLQKIYYSSFSEQPKTLDPARSYSNNEYEFIGHIYEPLLQYDYFIRPYQLVPLTAVAMPVVRYLKANNSEKIAYSIYTIHLKPGIFFQEHPAFAQNKKHQALYLDLPPGYLQQKGINKLSDFKMTGTRELKADDYIYQIKRLASPFVSSPIYGMMSNYIVGFSDFSKQLPKKQSNHTFIDLRQYPMKGLKKLSDYSFEITIQGEYSQFMFWLAMPFFSPIPWEADKFYAQAGMKEKNLSFDWYPVGTGPFYLSENNPNQHMILRKNTQFREEYYPFHGSSQDEKAGYLKSRGQRLPMIDAAIFTLEKESIPKWNKFLQGYYDEFAVTSDSYDQAIRLNSQGEFMLNEATRSKKLHLVKATELGFYYWGFNMLDPIVGGNSERARKLRQAISIALDMEEYINIFLNGRGNPAQGPLPPGIFGFQKGQSGVNSYMYQWSNHTLKRRDLAQARALMKAAGYPGGLDPETKSALILHFDIHSTGAPDEKAMKDWMRKQFARIGIALDVRETQYNRFQEKLRSGNAQIFKWAWLADYPDPENFLFLLYGGNGKVKFGGENASNYFNPAFDLLFEQLKNLKNDSERLKLINAALDIIRRDAPLIWGFNTQKLLLTQSWVSLVKPNPLNVRRLKYIDLDLSLRNKLRGEWNHPVLWPIGFLLFIVMLIGVVFYLAYRRKDRMTAKRLRG